MRLGRPVVFGVGLSTDAVDRSTTCSTPALTACSTKASMLEDAA
jgi:hypothetical protein